MEDRQNASDVGERGWKERKGRMKYFGAVVILVACTTTFVFSNAQESPSPAEEQPSISPDKKWGYSGEGIFRNLLNSPQTKL